METMKNNVQNTINHITNSTQNYLIKKNKLMRGLSVSQLLLLSLSLIMSYFIVRHLVYYSIQVQSLDMMEGFENKAGVGGGVSNKKYVVKKNKELFDDFYVNVYDTLVFSDVKNTFELGKVTEHSVIDHHSKILDVGSGTGHHIAELLHMHQSLEGDNVVGIDTSQAMIKKARENYPEHKASFQKADVMKGSLFRDNTFTHILCLYFTIYYIKDKYRFFKNCHNWLQGGGTLFVHLVEPTKFDPIVPAGNPLEVVNVQNYADKRITDSKVIFNGFEYQAKFRHTPDKNTATFVEKFMFKDGKTRENEHTFYMEEKDVIIDQAKQAGFVVKGKIHMYKCGYENQYLYILQKV